MTVSFVVIAGALAGVAVAFAVVPLLRTRRQAADGSVRTSKNLILYEQHLAELENDLASGRLDADEFAIMKDELGADLLESTAQGDSTAAEGTSSWAAAVLVAVVVIITAVAGYAQLGALDDVALAEAVKSLRADAEPTDAKLAELMSQLQARVDRDPDDSTSWYLLGHTLMRQNRFGPAATAFEQLHRLTPGDLMAMVSLAQARYLSSGSISTDDRVLIDSILRRSPHEPVVREIVALDAFQRGEYAVAAGHLRQALAGSLSETRAQSLRAGLARAEAMAAEAGQEITDTPLADGAGGGFDVAVSLDPGIGPLPDSAVLFVLARRPGQRMPLMVVRREPAPGVMRVRLDQSTAMNPGMFPAVGEELQVVARLAMSGTAAAGPDDIEASTAPMALEARPRSVQLHLGTEESAGPHAVSGGFDVTVTLDPGIGPLPDSAVLFVLARRPGQRMPLMVVRRDLAAGPIRVRLDQTTAMNPAMPLTVGDQLQVVARLAMSGTAATGPDDIEAVSDPLVLEANLKGVQLHLAAET